MAQKTDKEILDNIRQWAEGNSDFLATRTDFSRGRKAGIQFAQDIILGLLNGGDERCYI